MWYKSCYRVKHRGSAAWVLCLKFKAEIKTPSDRQNAKEQLQKLMEEYINLLNGNDTLGSNGSYTVNNKKTQSSVGIPNDFK